MADQGLTAKLVQLTEHYLAMHLHESAVFTAERLLAVAPSEANRHLLATALVHGGRVARACAVLRGSRSPANVYLLARYCIATGAYSEAESVLLEAAGLAGRDPDAVVHALQGRPYMLPNGAAGVFLLAWAVHRAGRLDAAAKYYLLCLYLDPFNFVAFEALCKMGYYPHPAQTFTGARLTATGAFSDKPPKQEPPRRGAAPHAPTGLVMPSGDAADSFSAAHATAPLAVPSPLLSPITPAAKLLLLSPLAAAPPVPPPHSSAAGVSTPVLPQRSEVGGPSSAAAHTRPVPPQSALRSHPALAASLVGVASADRFGFAVAGPGEHGTHGDGAYGGAAAAAAFLGDLSAISPVPPEFRNDGTTLWSRVLGASMAPPESGGRFGGGGGGVRTDDFLRRPAGLATAATSAFGTPAAVGGAAGGRGRFLRHGGALAAGAASTASGGSSTSAVRPFLLPPGSAATVASAPGGAGAASAGMHHGVHASGAAEGAAGAAGEWEALDMGGAGAAEEGTPAVEVTGLATLPSAPGGTPALFIPGPAGIIMAGKRKARYVGGSELGAQSAGGGGAAGVTSATAGARGVTSSSRGGGAAPPSTVARPRFKRLSFSAGDGVAAAAAAAAAGASAGSSGQGLASPQHGARSRVGSGSASAARTLASQPPPPSPSMRRLRSHSDALAASSDASPGGGGGTAVSPNPKGRGLPRAASARHIAGPAFIAAALKGGGDEANGGAAASGSARALLQTRGTPTTAPSATASASLAAAGAPRAPSVPDVLQRGAQQLLLLLRTMAFAVRHLARFECEAALSTLAQLPEAQAESPWGLALRARAKHELGQHAEARTLFKLLHDKAPQRLDGMDIYSTVLWHLKAVPELTALADELISAQPGESTSWVVAANRFSVVRDHKRAIGALQRALQLDPGNVNAHTLLGHERTALALLDEALASFQRATGLEHRHYSAWYGMGTVYFRQGSLDLAELHYRKACDIHRHSPTLMCYLGMVLTAGKRFDAALEQLGRASALDPANPQVEYQKALVYGATGKHDLARRSLLRVLSVAPGEPAVLMQLGKACKHLGLFEEAATHLNAALGRCGPADKQSNIIRGMLQSLAAPTDDGDVVL